MGNKKIWVAGKKNGSIKKQNQIGLLMTSIRCFSFDVFIRVSNWNSMFYRKIGSLSQLNIFILHIRSRIHGKNQLPYLNKDFISNRFLVIDLYDERQRSLKRWCEKMSGFIFSSRGPSPAHFFLQPIKDIPNKIPYYSYLVDFSL